MQRNQESRLEKRLSTDGKSSTLNHVNMHFALCAKALLSALDIPGYPLIRQNVHVQGALLDEQC